MNLSFGARLRAQRERQQVSLHTISHDTKIKLSLLDALERDDLSHWPEGLFRRAWVKSYAQAIGLNPAEVLRDFLVLHPDPVEPAAPAPTGMRRFVAALSGRHIERAPQPAHVERGLQPPLRESTIAPVLEVAHFSEGDLPAIARICTGIVQAREWREVAPLLREASVAFDALGMILWLWEPRAAALRPAWAHGYPDEVVVNLPRVYRNADNAIAAAFGTEETAIVHGDDGATGAVVTPMMTPGGCIGVLAIELPAGTEASESTCALAGILAAQLAALFASTPLAEAASA
jgi:GAF domain-containing protein